MSILMTHSNQNLHDNKTVHDRKIFRRSIVPAAVANFFLTQMLTRDLFAVANLLVYNGAIKELMPSVVINHLAFAYLASWMDRVELHILQTCADDTILPLHRT